MITSPKKLFEILNLENNWLRTLGIYKADKNYQLAVPKIFIDRMQPENINDPLLRQILPTRAELENRSNYSADPLEEKNYSPIPGLLHKYYGRALILVTNSCPINCRFCFRRHLRDAIKPDFTAILQYLKKNQSIKEIILSGGDPLILDDAKLSKLIAKLSSISHLKRLRIHSRIPIVLPKRITTKLVHKLSNHKLQTVLVIHCNHANEIDRNVIEALQKIKKANIAILNQSVLLKGVNDTVESLINLSEKLFANGVQPYYLHMLDKVIGASHFEVSDKKAKALLKALAEKLPGYLVPKLVRDDHNSNSKTIL